MPSQEFLRRQLNLPIWQYQQLLAVVLVIVPAIAIIFMKPFTDIDPVILINGDIAPIKEGMEVRLE